MLASLKPDLMVAQTSLFDRASMESCPDAVSRSGRTDHDKCPSAPLDSSEAGVAIVLFDEALVTENGDVKFKFRVFGTEPGRFQIVNVESGNLDAAGE